MTCYQAHGLECTEGFYKERIEDDARGGGRVAGAAPAARDSDDEDSDDADELAALERDLL